jgi:NCS1 family nucleobase:cation symporter-1
MIADYFFVRRGELVLNDLYKRHGVYEYSRGFNWIAIGALALGVAPSLPGFASALRGVPETGVFGTLYNWAWFVGFLLSALIYVVGMRVMTGSREQGTVGASV